MLYITWFILVLCLLTKESRFLFKLDKAGFKSVPFCKEKCHCLIRIQYNFCTFQQR